MAHPKSTLPPAANNQNIDDEEDDLNDKDDDDYDPESSTDANTTAAVAAAAVAQQQLAAQQQSTQGSTVVGDSQQAPSQGGAGGGSSQSQLPPIPPPPHHHPHVPPPPHHGHPHDGQNYSLTPIDPMMALHLGVPPPPPLPGALPAHAPPPPQPNSQQGPDGDVMGARKPRKHLNDEEWNRQRKNNHKEVERRRRGNINEGINELGRIVPNAGGGEKAKGAILARAVAYIHSLKENEARNIEKWTLEKLLMDQAMGDLQGQIDDYRRRWEEETQKRIALERELDILKAAGVEAEPGQKRQRVD